MPLKLDQKQTPNTKPKINNKIIFVVGPTGIGKSRVAVELAGKINGQIISCDSMQLYKGMDILTSKPPAALKKRIKHYLIDLVPHGREFNASRYRREALKRIKEINEKGKIPIFVGGTGLYVSILLDGIFKGKRGSPDLRKKLYKEATKFGSDYLYKKLKKADIEAAGKIHPNDIKRVIRALEVFLTTGKPISELQKDRQGLINEYDIKIFCLSMNRAKLYEKIDERVEKMFKQGLTNEVKRLLKKKLSKTACFAIGINELRGYFEGLYDLDEAKRLIKRNTRHYAKSQLTWFRREKRALWINIKNQETPKEIARRLSLALDLKG